MSTAFVRYVCFIHRNPFFLKLLHILLRYEYLAASRVLLIPVRHLFRDKVLSPYPYNLCLDAQQNILGHKYNPGRLLPFRLPRVLLFCQSPAHLEYAVIRLLLRQVGRQLHIYVILFHPEGSSIFQRDPL